MRPIQAIAATALAIGLYACATPPAQDEAQVDATAKVTQKKVVRISIEKDAEATPPGPGDRIKFSSISFSSMLIWSVISIMVLRPHWLGLFSGYEAGFPEVTRRATCRRADLKLDIKQVTI